MTETTKKVADIAGYQHDDVAAAFKNFNEWCYPERSSACPSGSIEDLLELSALASELGMIAVLPPMKPEEASLQIAS